MCQRGAGFRQEEGGQGPPARLQRNASCPLATSSVPGTGQGSCGEQRERAWPCLEDTHVEGRSQPQTHRVFTRLDLTPEQPADSSNLGTPGLRPPFGSQLLSRAGPWSSPSLPAFCPGSAESGALRGCLLAPGGPSPPSISPPPGPALLSRSWSWSFVEVTTQEGEF